MFRVDITYTSTHCELLWMVLVASISIYKLWPYSKYIKIGHDCVLPVHH